jgi:CheY-specific phosphatase CheX
VTWVFPQPIALELVSRLMADPAPDPELAGDGASELANILTGHASAALETHGLHCEFGAPSVHEGSLPGGTAFRMTTSAGPIDVIFSMRSDRAVAS